MNINNKGRTMAFTIAPLMSRDVFCMAGLEEDLPQAIILDMGQPIVEFKQHLKSVKETEFFTNEIVHSIVNCLSTKEYADYELREFVAEVEFSEFMEEERPGLYIHCDLAGHIFDLGMTIKEQIDKLNLYNEYGELLYLFDETNSLNTKDVVLIHAGLFN